MEAGMYVALSEAMPTPEPSFLRLILLYIHTTRCPQVMFATISTLDSREQYLETRCSVNIQQRKA